MTTTKRRGGEREIFSPLDFTTIKGEEEDIERSLASFPHERIREGDYGVVVVPKMQAAKQLHRPPRQTWGNPDASVKIMALHGWLDNSNTWNTFIPLLLSRSPCPLHVVAVDFAGHGLSTHRPPTSFYHNIQYALDSFGVATELGWEKFILMGHSMGGIVSTVMAALLPNRIVRTISVDTCGPFVPPGGRNFADSLAKDFKRAPELLGRKPRVYGSFEALFDRYRRNNATLKEQSAHMIVSRAVERVRIDDDEVSEDQQSPQPQTQTQTQVEKSGAGQYGYCFRHDPRIVGGKMEVYTEEMVASLFQRMTKPIMIVLANRKNIFIIIILFCFVLFCCYFVLFCFHLSDFRSFIFLIFSLLPRIQFDMVSRLTQKRVKYFKNCEWKVVVVDGEHHVHLDNPERIIDSVLAFWFPKKAKL